MVTQRKTYHLYIKLILLVCFALPRVSFANGDTLKKDSIFPRYSPQFYQYRYGHVDLMSKSTNNLGKGLELLYGTRNFRSILHGVAYRGGANNTYNRYEKRKNQNPLQQNAVDNLCQEGFSSIVYLYKRNFETVDPKTSCACEDSSSNEVAYLQRDYFEEENIKELISLVYESAVNEETGPVYLHCWNGWHASGLISAILLKQFCGYSDEEAVNYWDLGTDGNNRATRYNSIRKRIRDFKPYPEYIVRDELGAQICPDWPEFVDSSNFHFSLEHLSLTPEAIPLGTTIILDDVRFKPNTTSFPNPSQNASLKTLIRALKDYPDLEIELGGHTDNIGNASDNKTTSRRRAKFIYNYLVRSGISADRLSYAGYGECCPVENNADKWGRSKNRRIEVKLTNKYEGNQNLLVDESKLQPVETKKEIKVEHTYIENTKDPGKHAPSKQYIINLIDYAHDFYPGDEIMLYSVSFEPNSTRIGKKSEKDLDNLVRALKKNEGLKVQVNGYTDSSGHEVSNFNLSNKRAKAVYEYVRDHGISAGQIQFQGFGAANPRYSNKTPEGRAKNRRIEVQILSNKHAIKSEVFQIEQDHTLADLKNKASSIPEGTSIMLTHLRLKPKKEPDLKNKDVQDLVQLLQQNPDLRLQIEAHCDNSLDKEKAKLQTEVWAKALYDHLKAQGISMKKITYKARGNTYPRFDQKGPVSTGFNNRIELKFISATW